MKILFISDLHLGADYMDVRAHERRAVAFLRSEAHDADHIYLLGDVLDYWYEYRNVVPRGFVRFFGELARLADSGVKITWMTGNHDIWLFDYLRDELGIEVIDAPFIMREIAGKCFLLAHGDRIGRSSAGFRLICSLFRNKICQRLFASLHPGLTVPLAKRWSHSSRDNSCETPAQKTAHIRHILADAEKIAAEHPEADYIIEGHHHLTLLHKLSGREVTLAVLGDWISHDSYAIFNGNILSLNHYNHEAQS